MRRSKAAGTIFAALALGTLFLSGGPVVAQTELRIATWNVAWLNRNDDQGNVPRRPADYARLAKYAKRLKADIIALQEIDGPEAAQRIFDPNVYAFHFEERQDVQRVGFAVKKNLQVERKSDVSALALDGNLRSGVDIIVTVDGRPFRMLAVHLKCCCPEGAVTANTSHCTKLRAQVPLLEEWIDARAAEALPFAVLGDFNRRLAPLDPVWREVDDSEPPNADLHGIVVGLKGRCWTHEQQHAFIDHIVFDKRATNWFVPGTAHQIMYDESDRPHKPKISDHCPLRATLRAGG